MHNYSYENEFNLHVNEISFSYEKMGTKTRLGEEAKGNSEMAYYITYSLHRFEVCMIFCKAACILSRKPSRTSN